MRIEKIQKAKQRRKWRVRKKVSGTTERPRLAVFRSNKHIYVQIIDDGAGLTLASASTMCKTLRGTVAKTGNKAAAEAVGKEIAKQAMQVGIKCVQFDRSSYKFHGRVKALADSARKAGLVF